MTPAATPEALVDQIARILDPDAHHLGRQDYYGPEPILAGASARVRVARKAAVAIIDGPLATATAEAASLRAEAAAKDRARDDALKAAIRAWSAKLHIPVTRMMSRELRAEFNTALASAATAGEG